LESRYCLSTAVAPQIAFDVVPVSQQAVEICGTVTGENPGAQVNLSGAVTGTTSTDTSGHFDIVLPTTQAGGTVYGQAIDQLTAALTNLGSAQIPLLSGTSLAPATLSGSSSLSTPSLGGGGGGTPFPSSTPNGQMGTLQIVNFAGSNPYDGKWVFSGVVKNGSPASTYVEFSGMPEVDGITVNIGSDGSFSLTATIQASEHGTVCAQAMDGTTYSNIVSTNV